MSEKKHKKEKERTKKSTSILAKSQERRKKQPVAEMLVEGEGNDDDLLVDEDGFAIDTGDGGDDFDLDDGPILADDDDDYGYAGDDGYAFLSLIVLAVSVYFVVFVSLFLCLICLFRSVAHA
jgi:hypothetical protein